MIKKLLTLVAIGGFAIMNAQSGKKAYPAVSSPMAADMSAEKATAQSCSTVSVINPTSSVTFYGLLPDTSTAGCSPVAGYVSGNNCYGLSEHAQFFPSASYSTIVSPSITAVTVGLYRNPTTFKGTKGTGAVGMKIYGVMSGTNTPAASAVVSGTASLVNIVAAQTGTSSLFFYTFTLTPTALPANGFFASVVLPTAAGDTAVIFQQTATASSYSATLNNGGAWENYGGWDTEFADYGPANIKMNDVMYPVVCGSGAVNVSKNLGISKNITLMPNPSTGVVNVIVTLPQSENISLTVTNALGQQISSRMYNGISNEHLSLDLTSQPNGVYFVTVSNGADKMVQRLIINK